MSFHGGELLRIWEAGKDNGLSQRKLARYLGVGFNGLHGKIFREQKKLEEQPLSVEPKVYDRVFLKAAIFDIETTSFKTGGVRDHLVCCSILPLLDDKVSTVKVAFEDQRDDKRALLETMEALKEYDILIGHNITAFDSGWLGSRLAFHGLPVPDHRWLLYDTYQAARRMAIKAERKSMAFLCDYFQINAIKTSVYPVAWGMIDSPNKAEFDKALTDIVYHCEQDVLANRQLFDALWPLDRTMVNLPVAKRI
jgi:DNA polymerase elongation subunit (family B)